MATHLQIWFMPWAGLNAPVKMGPVTFWPWKSEAGKRICDDAARAHLDRLFKSYVNHDGAPVDTVTICSHRNAPDLHPWNQALARDVRRAADALFFACFVPRAVNEICSGFPGWGPPTADVFKLIRQNFIAGDDYVAVATRSLMTAGYRIERVRFSRPFATGGGPSAPSRELARGLHNALSGKAKRGLVNRLFQALEWFRLAHIEEGEVSEFSRVVLMATAFEVLLRAYGKKELARRVDALVAYPDLSKSRRAYNTKGQKNWLSFSKPACWIWDFYNLRSAIVHGKRISPIRLVYKDPITHLNAAEMLFCQIVNLELFRHRCMGGETRRTAAKIARVSGKANPEELAEFMEKIDPIFKDVHQAMGWAEDDTDLSAYQDIRTLPCRTS